MIYIINPSQTSLFSFLYSMLSYSLLLPTAYCLLPTATNILPLSSKIKNYIVIARTKDEAISSFIIVNPNNVISHAVQNDGELLIQLLSNFFSLFSMLYVLLLLTSLHCLLHTANCLLFSCILHLKTNH